PDLVVLAGAMIADGATHTGSILLKSDQLVVEPDTTGIELLGVVLEDRLQADLRQVRRGAGTGIDVLGVSVPRAPEIELADQAARVRVRSPPPGQEPGARPLAPRR